MNECGLRNYPNKLLFETKCWKIYCKVPESSRWKEPGEKVSPNRFLFSGNTLDRQSHFLI